MDFSQLPKMSNTPATPPPADDERPLPVASPTTARQDFALTHSGGFGFGGVWVSLIAGVICFAFSQTFIRWAVATLHGQDFPTGFFWEDGPKAGQPRTYFELIGGTAWVEAGLSLMGVALLLDAALMLVAYRGRLPHRTLVLAAVVVTALAVAFNAGVFVYVLAAGFTSINSLIALLVGGMVLFDHVPLLRRTPKASL